MKHMKLSMALAGLAALTVAVIGLMPMTVGAATDCALDANKSMPVCQAKSGVNSTGGTGAVSFEENFKTITNTILYILGAVAVLMIIIGGVRYVVSGGDSSAVSGAKNTILYAVIGLVVAMLAFAIVNFIIGRF